MSHDTELGVLNQGIDAWNEWRRSNPGLKPQLTGADLSDMNLAGANLAEAVLDGVELFDSNLDNTNLEMVRMRGADLRGARLEVAVREAPSIW